MKELRKLKVYMLIAALVLCLHAAPSLGTAVYSFEIFTDNGLFNDSEEINIFMEVSNGAFTADFKIFNESTTECAVTGVYFMNGSLLGLSSVTGSAGVDFTTPANPSDLPGQNDADPPFVTHDGFSTDSDPPPYWDGVNNSIGEYVTVTFDLNGTLTQLIEELDSGAVRVGVHIQGFTDGSSESAIMPEPSTVILLGLGTLALIRKRRPSSS